LVRKSTRDIITHIQAIDAHHVAIARRFACDSEIQQKFHRLEHMYLCIRSVFLKILLLSASLIGFSVPAQVLYSTGFETPEYHLGSLDGQDGWSTSFAGATSTAMIQSDRVKDGANALQINAGSTQSGVIKSSLVMDALSVTISTDIYIESSSRISNWQFGVYHGFGGVNITTSGAIQFASPGFPSTPPGIFSRDAWHSLRVEYDLAEASFAVYLDNNEVGSGLGMFPGFYYEFVSINSFGGSTADDRAFVDNVTLSMVAIPEFGPMSVLVASALLCVGIYHRVGSYCG